MKRSTVLVADDDPRILAAFERSLRNVGQLLLAADAATAVRLAAIAAPHAAIVDLRLGKDSGISVILELKRIRPTMRIALLSGYLTVEEIVAATKAGADVVVPKPATPSEILRRLDDASVGVDLSQTSTLERVEWEHIHRVLADANGNVSEAARRMRMRRQVLQRRLRKPMPPG